LPLIRLIKVRFYLRRFEDLTEIWYHGKIPGVVFSQKKFHQIDSLIHKVTMIYNFKDNLRFDCWKDIHGKIIPFP